jgi:hypothetical protein
MQCHTFIRIYKYNNIAPSRTSINKLLKLSKCTMHKKELMPLRAANANSLDKTCMLHCGATNF